MTDSSEKDRPEFDRYAHSYAELLEDPIRNLFAHHPPFPPEEMASYRETLKALRCDSEDTEMAGIGCGRGELLKLAGSYS
jgi:hypothetical protein